MQTETTLENVITRVDAMSANCYDKNIHLSDISFDSLETMNIAGEPHPVRPLAQRAISARLGVPYAYLQKCPQEIQADNLNYWISKVEREKLFFRFDASAIRAVFTERYIPIDNFEIMERLDFMGYKPDTQVQCSLDDEFMSLSIPDGKQAFSINGDKFKPGISISNSEVGLASCSISSFVLRLVCTNGLISQSSVQASYRHISNKILSEFPDVMNKVALELGNKREQFRLSLDSSVDDPCSTMASFNRQFQLNEKEKEAVSWGWSHDVGTTMFHVIQAYTKGGQYKDLTAESSFKLQRVGGNILEMVE